MQPESLLQIRWGNLSSWFLILKNLIVNPDLREKPFSDPDGYVFNSAYFMNNYGIGPQSCLDL